MNREKWTVENEPWKVISPEKWFKDVTDRGAGYFPDHFRGLLPSIIFMDHFYGSLLRITFMDHFYGYLVDSIVDKKGRRKVRYKIFFFQKLYFFEKFSISTPKQKIVIS